jgi:hypothetical protein
MRMNLFNADSDKVPVQPDCLARLFPGDHREGPAHMRKLILTLATLALSVSFNAVTAPRAFAQYCEGEVHGLSSHYNPSTGSGFLAVRAAPRKSASQVGELFNGDKVEIFDRRGNWYKVAALDGSSEGWSSAKYIWNDCDY